jgi:hypothetical protein
MGGKHSVKALDNYASLRSENDDTEVVHSFPKCSLIFIYLFVAALH